MSEWWERLAERERRIIGIGAAALALLLLYVGLLEPAQIRVAAARARHDAQLQLLHNLERTAAQVESFNAEALSAGALPAGMTLQAAVEQSLQAASLRKKIATLALEDSGAVRVEMNDVPLATAMQWLLELRRQYGVRVQFLEASHGNQLGAANIALTLRDND